MQHEFMAAQAGKPFGEFTPRAGVRLGGVVAGRIAGLACGLLLMTATAVWHRRNVLAGRD